MDLGGPKRAVPTQPHILPPYYNGTTIFFTETLANFLLFYALQHKLPLTLRGAVPTDPLHPPLSRYILDLPMDILLVCKYFSNKIVISNISRCTLVHWWVMRSERAK